MAKNCVLMMCVHAERCSCYIYFATIEGESCTIMKQWNSLLFAVLSNKENIPLQIAIYLLIPHFSPNFS